MAVVGTSSSEICSDLFGINNALSRERTPEEWPGQLILYECYILVMKVNIWEERNKCFELKSIDDVTVSF